VGPGYSQAEMLDVTMQARDSPAWLYKLQPAGDIFFNARTAQFRGLDVSELWQQDGFDL
jgi:hypothetical protein